MNVLPEIQPLLAEGRFNELVVGAPNLALRAQLQELERGLPSKARDRDFALACVAGLWLHHDFFDESHAISQDLETAEGSYWHGILHRREPDYGNAKYWFARVGVHPIHHELREAVLKLASGRMWPTFLGQKSWDAAGFVDLCEMHASPHAMAHDFCRRIQRIEWHQLFTYCHVRAFVV
jgi:hypothetical protein